MDTIAIKNASLSEVLESHIDAFICCASFESRCLAIANLIDPSHLGIAIVAEHKNVHDHVAANAAKMMSIFGDKAIELTLFTNSPIQCADHIYDVVKKNINGKYIVVDITTFTHETLLILVQILARIISKGCRIVYVYSVADDYDPGTPTADKWLSKGNIEIRSILGCPGDIIPGRENHLILLHGFEAERSKALIAEYQPEKLSLGIPIHKLMGRDRHVEGNSYVHSEVLRYAKNVTDAYEFQFAMDSPEDCKSALSEQAARWPYMNVAIAPMNSKLSTLGALLAALTTPSIQLCYAQPALYNYRNYSTASDECYVCEIPSLLA